MAGQLVDMSDSVRERIRFGPFEADMHTHELWKEGIRIRLIGQPFEILAVLLSKPGQLVTREALRARLWPADTFVDFNHGLNAAVNKLREALCDSADEPRYIETLPRRGYRFIAAVEHVAIPAKGRSQDQKTVQRQEPVPEVPAHPSEAGKDELIFSADEPSSDEKTERLRSRSIWLSILTPVVLLVVGIFAFLLWFYLSHNSSKRVGRRALLTPIPLTDLADPTSEPAFSPDGTRVAFRRQGYAAGNSGIFVKKIGSQQLLQLTTNPEDCCPVWSPDGQTIAFSRFNGKEHEIYTLSAAGGGPRKLYSTAIGPRHGALDWSPDGESIAFAGESPQGTSSIFVLSKEGVARRVTETPPLNRDWGPAFSPDGQSLAFIRTQEIGLPENILVMPAGGGESRTVVTFYNGILGPPAWTSDGQFIVFASGAGLLRAPVFGGDQLTRIEEAGSAARHPATASKAYALAYQGVSEAYSVWELNPSDGNPTSHGLIVSESGRNEGAQVSLDGKKVAFMSSRSGSMELWISDRDGSNPYQVTAMNGIGTPRWSPNGRSIAFDVGWRERGAIFVVDVPGGVPRPIAQENSDNLVPNWSRDGKWVYFASNRTGMWQVWKKPVQGGAPVQVTTHGGFAAYPSPDGRTLYYSKFNMPDPEVWRVPVEGGLESRIPQIRPADWASWATVEKGIYFVARDSGERANLMFFEFATAGVKKISTLDKLPFWLTASADGNSVLYEHLDQENSHIMLLQNFR
jgi:Tol biopolymer transport system component/DNA-binding winged helix-turn-helix (wHTH) protein